MFHLIENTAVTFKALTQTPAELVGVVVGAVFFLILLDFCRVSQTRWDARWHFSAVHGDFAGLLSVFHRGSKLFRLLCGVSFGKHICFKPFLVADHGNALVCVCRRAGISQGWHYGLVGVYNKNRLQFNYSCG